MSKDRTGGVNMSKDREIIDTLHDALAKDLLVRVKSGEATASELAVAAKFLKDNNASLDVIQADTAMGNLLEALPFQPKIVGQKDG